MNRQQQSTAASLEQLQLDELADVAYDDLTRLAADVCQVPIAMIVVADQNRQWFKSRLGVDATEAPVDFTFCAHALARHDEVTLVEDTTADARFADNPFVTGPARIRFFLGAPLVTSQGVAIGTLCLLDQQPHHISPDQVEELRFLARQVVLTMEQRRGGAPSGGV